MLWTTRMKNCLALIDPTLKCHWKTYNRLYQAEIVQLMPWKIEGQLPVARLEGGNDGLMISHSNLLDCETISEKHELGLPQNYCEHSYALITASYCCSHGNKWCNQAQLQLDPIMKLCKGNYKFWNKELDEKRYKELWNRHNCSAAVLTESKLKEQELMNQFMLLRRALLTKIGKYIQKMSNFTIKRASKLNFGGVRNWDDQC